MQRQCLLNSDTWEWAKEKDSKAIIFRVLLDLMFKGFWENKGCSWMSIITTSLVTFVLCLPRCLQTDPKINSKLFRLIQTWRQNTALTAVKGQNMFNSYVEGRIVWKKLIYWKSCVSVCGWFVCFLEGWHEASCKATFTENSTVWNEM